MGGARDEEAMFRGVGFNERGGTPDPVEAFLGLAVALPPGCLGTGRGRWGKRGIGLTPGVKVGFSLSS